MAVLFELAVNFGTDTRAAETAADAVRGAEVVVRGISLPLAPPVVTRLGSPDEYIEFSVYLRGMGAGAPGPLPGVDPRSWTGEEISQAGRALYDLLRGLAGYRAAVVGWDPESLVDVQDLETDWRTGDPPAYDGLVLADDLCTRWELGPEWVSFSDGYRWLPYSGSKNLW